VKDLEWLTSVGASISWKGRFLTSHKLYVVFVSSTRCWTVFWVPIRMLSTLHYMQDWN